MLVTLPGQIPILLSTARISKVTFQDRYAKDPELLQFYKDKLLIPGWAGELDSVELTCIKSQLKLSPTLRIRWGVKPSARRLSKKRAREVARNGLSAIKKPVLASAAVEERVRKY